MGFHGIDSVESFSYNSIPNSYGLGETNNELISRPQLGNNTLGSIGPTINKGVFGSHNGNEARRKRMTDTSFDPTNANATITNFTNTTSLANIGKSYCSSATNATDIVYFVNGILPAQIINSLLKNLLLMREPNILITMRLNAPCKTVINIVPGAANAAGNYASVFSSLASNNITGVVLSQDLSLCSISYYNLGPSCCCGYTSTYVNTWNWNNSS